VVFAEQQLRGGLQLTQFDFLGICVGGDGRAALMFNCALVIRHDLKSNSSLH
jgi:hypothetical protein